MSTSPPSSAPSPRATHFDPEGRARMVDVGQKTPTAREAVACGRVCLGPEAFRAVVAGTAGKGDVLGVARIAGIQAAKRTADWIPLAHSLPLESIEIAFDPIAQTSAIEIRATARTTAKTGVEMEALVAVSAAALTIYDMCKAIHKGIVIEEITLLRKSGGKSGLYEAPQRPTAGKAEASTEA